MRTLGHASLALLAIWAATVAQMAATELTHRTYAPFHAGTGKPVSTDLEFHLSEQLKLGAQIGVEGRVCRVALKHHGERVPLPCSW